MLAALFVACKQPVDGVQHMPYLFKLSRRVARTRAAFILATAVAIAAACESERLLPSGPEKPELATTAGAVGTVSDLSVTAASDTSLTVAFTAVGDGAGLPASYDVRYAVSPIGWGSATSVARGTCATPLAGGSTGSTQTCTILGLTRATKYDVQLVPFSGTLSLNAVFGSLSNVATASTISATPSSGTALLRETFDDANFAARGWYDNTAMVMTTAQRTSGSVGALEVHFLPGSTTPTWGGAARHLFPETESVYLSYWVKYSSNWVGSGHTYHPHEFLLLTNEDDQWVGPSFTHLTAYVEHSYQNGGIPVLQLQDGTNIDQSRTGQDLTNVTENRSAAGCNGNTDGYPTGCYILGGSYTNEKKFLASRAYFMPSPGVGYKGDWHLVEAYFQLNAIQGGKGVPNGVVRYWFDGQLAIERTNVMLRTGAHPNMKFKQLIVAPYVGGGSPVDQTMWVDNLTVGTGRITPSVPTVASVTVAPASASVTVGGTYAFTTTLKDATGAVLTGQAVTWTSSDTGVATVSDSGVASGISAGSTTITATSGSVSGSATLAVNAPLPLGTVSDLSVTGVTDTSVTLSFTEVTDGAGQPASYDGRYATGSLSWGSAANVPRGTCAAPVAGTAIGAKRTCTVLGLTKATSYQFQMVAFRGTLNVNAVFGALSNAASGTTSGALPPPPPPPPPPSSGSWPNEPAGFSLISDYGFGDVIPVTNDPIALGSSGWRAQWNTAGNGTLIADAGAPVSLGGVYQVRYPMGFVDGTAPSTVEHPLPSRPTELYWGVWWKPSNPFQSDASGVNKIAFIWTPSGNTDLIYFDLSPNPWRIRAMDDLYAGGGPDAGKRDEPNVTTTVITLGQWHRIEIYVKYSTGANADGILKWWVDGVLNGTYTNLKMVQDGGFNSVSFSPTYGGAGGDVKTETDYYWFDHTRLSRP